MSHPRLDQLDDGRWIQGFTRMRSAIVSVTKAAVITELPFEIAHHFIGVQFFNDAEGDVRTDPTSGAIVVTIETVNNEGRYESPPDNIITANTPSTIGWGANTLSVKLDPDGITGATHWRAIYTGNRS